VPTVPVAEADAVLRYAVCRFLMGCGFRVLEAPDGGAAIEMSRQHRGKMDLVLTDLQPPGPDGLDLLRTIELERPGTNIIAVTAEDIRLPIPALRKPFEFDDLLAEIVGVLVRR
jgi:CheY-like chemotaxis protein